jgi:hypothetical protein
MVKVSEKAQRNWEKIMMARASLPVAKIDENAFKEDKKRVSNLIDSFGLDTYASRLKKK